jgi:hypothetical protein
VSALKGGPEAAHGAGHKVATKSEYMVPHVDLDLFVAIDRMSSAILAWGFCIFAAISSRRHNHQPALGAPARRPPARFDRPPVGAWMGSRLAWRGIELSRRRRSRATAKGVAV